MLTQSEIVSVLDMLRNENLDVRTVTLGLNLLDCASDDIQRFTDKVSPRLQTNWSPSAIRWVKSTVSR